MQLSVWQAWAPTPALQITLKLSQKRGCQARWLRTLIDLSEDWGLDPSTHL